MKRFLICLFAASVAMTGCVSTKTHQITVDELTAKKAEADKASAELSSAKQTNESLKKEVDKLKKDVADLSTAKEGKDKEVEALKAKLDELSSKGIMTSQEIADLRKEKERLSASDKAKTEELASLQKAKADELSAATKAKDEAVASFAKEKEYLSRENDRLKLKAGEISTEKEKEVANVKNAYENLVKEMKKEIEKGDIKITQAVDRLSVNLVEKVLFASGEAEVKPAGLKVLKRVGDILKTVTDKQIRVEGHTDNVKIGGSLQETYPTNWELSTARATNVVRYLQDKVGINGKLLSAAGLSAYKPVASNDTVSGRAQNRRIEIVLLPLDVDRVLQELKK